MLSIADSHSLIILLLTEISAPVFLAVLALVKIGDLKIIASNEAIYNFTIQISTGDTKFGEIVLWLKNNTEAV
ncbi:MAG: hypothetical protein ACKVOM_03905 [Ferruginibacter sp.]